MSESKSPVPAKPAAAKPPAGPSVIRRLSGAEETNRLTKKHLPAWVASGAVHLIVILLAWLILGGKSEEQIVNAEVVNTSVTKEDEPPVEDLTNDDVGLDSNIIAAVDVERETERTVDAMVTADPIGVPDANLDTPNAIAPPGLNTADLTTSGLTGETGNFQQGTGGIGGFGNGNFEGRSGGTKAKMLQEGGGNMDSELAVARGLAWLAKQQKPDGGWTYDGSHAKDRIAATGMALLPFLAAGETHKNGKKYREVVFRGLNFLISNMNSNGSFKGSTGMYSHGIAAIALCEAYGMTRDRTLLLRPTQAVVNFDMTAQGANGSWGYQSGRNGDTSIVGWQVQALQAARLGRDLVVNDNVIKKTNSFLDEVSGGSRKATYGYASGPGAPGTALTAVGLLCRYYFSGWGPANGGMAEGVEGLMKNGPKPGTKASPRPLGNLYYYYYATQVVHFYGGKDWRDWNEGPLVNGKRTGGMRDWLVWLQVAAGNNSGSWEPDAGTIGSSCGRVGTTSMALLTLEVYYRHLPLYKREGAGGGENLK